MLLDLALAAFLVAQATPHPPASSGDRVPAPDCRFLLSNPTAGTTELCQAKDTLVAAEAAAEGSDVRVRQFTAAAEQFSRAANLLRDPKLRLFALESLTRIYEPSGLNDPARAEYALREMTALMPGDSSPLRRIAKVQEEHGNVDGAESTLLSARQQMPDDAEVYNELSAFYARRAAALKTDAKSRVPAAGDQPDADGYYRISDSVAPPEMLVDVEPGFIVDPPPSDDPDLVVLEVSLTEDGQVLSAKVLKSVPGGDAQALKAVEQWRFKPTIVDGRPVRMKITVAVRIRRP